MGTFDLKMNIFNKLVAFSQKKLQLYMDFIHLL
jgi:hypothetical protein